MECCRIRSRMHGRVRGGLASRGKGGSPSRDRAQGPLKQAGLDMKGMHAAEHRFHVRSAPSRPNSDHAHRLSSSVRSLIGMPVRCASSPSSTPLFFHDSAKLRREGSRRHHGRHLGISVTRPMLNSRQCIASSLTPNVFAHSAVAPTNVRRTAASGISSSAAKTFASRSSVRSRPATRPRPAVDRCTPALEALADPVAELVGDREAAATAALRAATLRARSPRSGAPPGRACPSNARSSASSLMRGRAGPRRSTPRAPGAPRRRRARGSGAGARLRAGRSTGPGTACRIPLPLSTLLSWRRMTCLDSEWKGPIGSLAG